MEDYSSFLSFPTPFEPFADMDAADAAISRRLAGSFPSEEPFGLSSDLEVPETTRVPEMTDKRNEKRIKKPRFAFQTKSKVDILDDGYRWRKYGQKAVKNNKFPRSYYRCTYQGCGVKKQVQRLTGDESVVVTTYEGTHSHPIAKSTDNFENILSQMHIYIPH